MIRILHRHDLARKTRIMEERLDGKGPWYLVEDGHESPEAGYVTGDTGKAKGAGPTGTARVATPYMLGLGQRSRVRDFLPDWLWSWYLVEDDKLMI